MAKAAFNKGDKVYVKPVGAWAKVEAVLPQWVRGVEEPLRVLYDVGMGREFQAHELMPERRPEERFSLFESEQWRIVRMRNRLSLSDENETHPHPGTHPVIVTDTIDWGGWRVPMAEYERDPQRIEHQARILANGLRLLRVASELVDYVDTAGPSAPVEVRRLAEQAQIVLDIIYDDGAGAKFAPKPAEDVSPQLR